jgi:hypothetical protein
MNKKSGRILKAGVDHNGHLLVSLHNRGKGHSKLVHRLVAQAFLLSKPENKDKITETVINAIIL